MDIWELVLGAIGKGARPRNENSQKKKMYHHKSHVCSIACSHMYNHMQSSESISKESIITLFYKWEDSVLEGQASILFA